MRWGEIPVGARRYILYHVFIAPLLITWYMLPIYMFMTGYSILEVGAIYSGVHLASIPATYLLGRLFDRLDIRRGLATIDVLEGCSSILYGLSYGPLAPVLLFTGLLLEEAAGTLYPLYQAAEKTLYPRDRLEEVFAWHMRLPEASQLAGFLVLGYVFGYIYTTPSHYRLGFLLFGIASYAAAAYILVALPPMGPAARKEKAVERGVDRSLRPVLVIELLTTLAWSLAPSIVFLNYVVNVLHATLFEAMLCEAAVSLGAIAATYITENAGREAGGRMVATGYALIIAWAAAMSLSPPLPAMILAYFAMKFGDTMVFPYYRAWLFRRIPGEKSASLFAALSSYRRVIGVATPVIAAALATIHPTLPYTASLILFAASAIALYTYIMKQ